MSNYYSYQTDGDYISLDSPNFVEQVIEPLISIGSKNKEVNETLVKKSTEINKKINNSQVISGMAKLVSSSLNEVSNENSSELAKMIALSNTLNISNVKGSNFTLSGVNQQQKIQQKLAVKSIQSISNKIKTAITKKINDKFHSVISNTINEEKTNEATGNKSSTVGGIIQGLGKDVASTAKNIFSASIGSSTSKVTKNSTITNLKKDLNLDNSFKLKKNKEIRDQLGNKLKGKQLQKCAADTKANNVLNVKNIDVTGPVKITNINQISSIKAVMNCSFNQKVLNNLSQNLVNDLETNIANMITSANKESEIKKNKFTSGDIAAAGTAIKATLEGVGEAAIPVGKGISAAAQGIGKGVSTAAKGVGQMWSSMVLPLFLLLIIIGVGFYVYTNYFD